ncbi:hypothetical protein LT493_44360 [Streptomyces tricolor]|nr:hypothetical protein [Streptomyces tricolor]
MGAAAPRRHGGTRRRRARGTGTTAVGEGTAAPALVDGIREQAPAARTAADAARAHLAAREDRYRIADPVRDLKPAGTLTSGGRQTVRLQQTHHGVPVLGGQYLVRMGTRGRPADRHRHLRQILHRAAHRHDRRDRRRPWPSSGPSTPSARTSPPARSPPARTARTRAHRWPAPPRTGRRPPGHGASSPVTSPSAAPTRRTANRCCARSTSTPGRVPGAPVQRGPHLPRARHRRRPDARGPRPRGRARTRHHRHRRPAGRHHRLPSASPR